MSTHEVARGVFCGWRCSGTGSPAAVLWKIFLCRPV